ncbi:MAG: YCF48-related protein [Acidobacteriota bacterium]|nr:YCF48-related protein [Acidobacteriota bacterium]
MRKALWSVALLLVGGSLFAAQGPKATAGQPKFKAIWERANYPKDINLLDVHFISADEGWAVGDKNTVLHTKDGAKTWEAQLGGDTESSDRELTEVFFLDAKHGWTRGGAEKLMRTSDGGASWEELGRLSQHEWKIHFVSPRTGFTARNDIKRTDDGGKTWKKVVSCSVELQADGLARKAACYFNDMTFPSTSVGYATGQFTGGVKGAVLARTKDGGDTWTLSAPENMEEHGRQVSFWNENSGLLTLHSGKTLMTTDGGKTWNGIVTPFGGEHPHYAMAGGQLGVIIQPRQIAYSTNGGRSYSSREFPVPAAVNAVTFPDAKHGYLVGEHGMIYRYHIVPADYASKGMIAAPMVGGN